MFLSIKPACLKSRVDPTLKIGGKVNDFHTLLMHIVLHMYLGDYVQDSERRKDPVTSTNGHNCAKDAIT